MQRVLLASNLRGDLFGGLTAAVVALPLALAFGVASGAGALAGLWGAILVGFFAAIFGGTPSQVSGPTGPMTVVMAIVITRFAHEPALAFTVVMLGGLFQILFGLLRFGRYINLVPYPVISGFMSGIGCIIIILQLAPLVGHPVPAGEMLAKIAALPALLVDPEADALIVGLLALAIVYLTPPRLSRILPHSLVALVVGTAAGIIFFSNAPVIGEIPSGLPRMYLPSFSLHDLPVMLRSALILAFLGSIDTLLTSLVADSITRTHHDSERELIGQGIGNLAAGVLGGIPGAGATMRTVVNVRAGGRTPLSGALHAVGLLVIVLGFGDVAEHIPLAVLAGILLKVGIDIIDWKYIRRLRHAPRAGIVIMLTTLALTIVVDLTTAVAVGMVMASVLFVKRMADAQMQSMKLVFDPSHVPDLTAEEADILERARGRIVLFHLEGPMSFGSAKGISRVLHSSKDKDVLIIDLSDVPFIDSSASITLEDVIEDAKGQGDVVILCGLRKNVLEVLTKIGVTRLIPPEMMVMNRSIALKKADDVLNPAPYFL
ncbi:MAG: SulP family inorganic anion transporter [Gammaproteobacteria bacterium]|nr:SulP family inorganic anion transporter [Gammaproteobacteria bacterium]